MSFKCIFQSCHKAFQDCIINCFNWFKFSEREARDIICKQSSSWMIDIMCVLYLFQLFLHHPLLLCHMFQLLRVFFRKLPSCFLGSSLLGWQGLFWLSVGPNLLLQKLLLHLKQLLGFPEPVLILNLLCVILMEERLELLITGIKNTFL